MSLIATLEALYEAGATAEMIIKVARRLEAEREVAASDRRAKDAERQRLKRIRDGHAESRDVTRTDRDTDGPSPHVGECSQVVTPSLSSLPSEVQKELKPPVSPSGLTAPKGSETARGSRLPENWTPKADYSAGDFGLTCEQHADELAKFLDYWRSVPGAKGRKTDWPATWRNWMRRASENSARKAPHERPDHDAKFERRQANYAASDAGFDAIAGRSWKP